MMAKGYRERVQTSATDKGERVITRHEIACSEKVNNSEACPAEQVKI